MNISIFGLGYVGLVTSAFLLRSKHKIYGVDVSKKKIKQLKFFETVLKEPGVNNIIFKYQKQNQFILSNDSEDAIKNSNISIICVGTPNNSEGDIDISNVKSVSRELGFSLKNKNFFHTILIRSTVLPNTCQKKIIPILENYSKKKNGVDFNVFFNPEFLREGTALSDFKNPSVTVFGSAHDKGSKTVKSIFKNVKGKIYFTDFQTSETLKYMNNFWHAYKINFANEFNMIANHFKVDTQLMQKIFTSDKKLNISDKYLKPGLPFGGSCLPKDVSALTSYSKKKKIPLILISQINKSNELQIKIQAKRLMHLKNYNILCLGYAFKENTDDFRESPILKIISKIVTNKNKKIYVFDKNINLKNLHGANLEFFNKYKKKLKFINLQEIRNISNYIQKIIIFNNHKYHKSIIVKNFSDIKEEDIMFF